MSKWTHSICDACWCSHQLAIPHRLLDPQLEICCDCGKATISGIYVREDPEKLLCKGQHGKEESSAE